MRSDTDQSCWDYPGPFPMSFASSPERSYKPLAAAMWRRTRRTKLREPEFRPFHFLHECSNPRHAIRPSSDRIRFEFVINLKKIRFPRTELHAYTASFQGQVGDLI